MSPFVEGRDENVINSFPVSDDPIEEAERHQSLRQSMIWMKDVYECAKNEAKRLKSEYGESVPAEQIIQSLTDEEYCQLSDAIMPWSHDEKDPSKSLRYHLFAVIMHHGTAYSGHYSAYIRDCMSEGNWTPPSASSQRKDDTSAASTKNELPKTLCFIQPRPGEMLVLESSPLNIVLSIVHSSFDDPNVTTVGRNRRQAAVITHNDNQPSIEVPHPSPPPPLLFLLLFDSNCCSWIS
jgi:hypothetical protein